jgi:hypothetical protein
MLVELRYLTTCYPDFFQGCSNEVLAISTFQTENIEDIVEAIYSVLNDSYWLQSFVVNNEEQQVRDLAETLFYEWKHLDWDEAGDDWCIYSYVELYPLQEDFFMEVPDFY